MDKKTEIREKALKDLRSAGVLMEDGHFDFGNGYHGTMYVNPHGLFRQPSTIWRLAQDLPREVAERPRERRVRHPIVGVAAQRQAAGGAAVDEEALQHGVVQPPAGQGIEVLPALRERRGLEDAADEEAEIGRAHV